MRQDIPWENPPNTEDEKTNNSLSIIDIFAKNGLQHNNILPDKREHPTICYIFNGYTRSKTFSIITS